MCLHLLSNFLSVPVFGLGSNRLLLLREYGKDERFKAIEKSRDRESMFNEYIADAKKKVSSTRSLLILFVGLP